MKKFLSFLLSLTLILSLFSGLTLRASAEEEVEGIYTLEEGQYTEVVTGVGEVRNVQIRQLIDQTSVEEYVELASSEDELKEGIITLYGVSAIPSPFVVLFNYLDEEHTSWDDPATGAFYAQYYMLFNVSIGTAENCSIEVDKTQALETEAVTITVTADPDFVVESLYIEGDSYYYGYDGLSYDKLSVYTFTLESMPGCDVTVTATAIDPRHRHEEGGEVYGALPEGYSGGTLAGGCYLLEENLSLTSDMVVEAGAEVIICVGGKLIDLNGHQIVNHGSLTLEDCGNAGYGVYLLKKDGEEGWSILEDSEDESGFFRIYGSSVVRGHGTQGGAICSDGSLTLSNVTIACSSADIGGGVYSTGTLTMKNNSRIAACEADIAGGVYSDGETSLSDVYIDTNTANETAGGMFIKDTAASGSFTVTGEVVIKSNKAAGESSNLLIGDGVQVRIEENENNDYMNIFFFTETAPTDGNDIVVLTEEKSYLYAFHTDNRDYSVIGSVDDNKTVLALSAHKHDWKYRTEEGAVIAYCDDSEAHELMLEEKVEMSFYDDMGYWKYPFTALLTGSVPTEDGYMAGEYELTREDISYYQKSGDSWEPIEEAILPGDYKAVLTKGEIEFTREFTITKGTIDWIPHTQQNDIAVGEIPEFYIVHNGVRYYGLYSRSEEGPFDTWDKVCGGIGTYYVRYEIEESDLYFAYSNVSSFDYCECVCWYDRTIDENLTAGFSHLFLDGKMQAKRYIFAWKGEGYTIRYDDEDQYYFCPDGDHVSEEPFYWQYDGTDFYYEDGGSRFYLSDGMTFSETPMKAELKHRVLDIDHHRGEWSGMKDNGDGTHSFHCIYCGADVTEKHTIDPETKLCTYCGAECEEETKETKASEETKETKKSEENPVTGDEAGRHMSLYIMLLSLGAAGTLGTAAVLKKRKKQ